MKKLRAMFFYANHMQSDKCNSPLCNYMCMAEATYNKQTKNIWNQKYSIKIKISTVLLFFLSSPFMNTTRLPVPPDLYLYKSCTCFSVRVYLPLYNFSQRPDALQMRFKNWHVLTDKKRGWPIGIRLSVETNPIRNEQNPQSIGRLGRTDCRIE